MTRVLRAAHSPSLSVSHPLVSDVGQKPEVRWLRTVAPASELVCGATIHRRSGPQ